MSKWLRDLVESNITSGERCGEVLFIDCTAGSLSMRGKMGDASDVANDATVFLASQSAKYSTGDDLVVNGGLESDRTSASMNST
jgi:NAD(P)-dependent dehydrogenase (short-subunit alcohol dehydrogenase family)